MPHPKPEDDLTHEFFFSVLFYTVVHTTLPNFCGFCGCVILNLYVYSQLLSADLLLFLMLGKSEIPKRAMSASAFPNLLSLIIVIAVTLVGMIGNGFIIISDCHDWTRSKTRSGPDLLLMALSLARLLFLGITLSLHCLSFLDINNPKQAGNVIIFFWAFSNAITLWITTCLGVFYCVKIVNFTQPFLVKIKLRISRMVPYLLVAAVLVSLISALPVIWIEACNHSCNTTQVLPNGGHEMLPKIRPQIFLLGLLYIIGTFPSFVIFLISSAFLIYSLVHHTKKMQQNPPGFRDQRMNVHLRATKILTSFLILYAATFVSEISMTLSPSPWTSVISIIVVASYNSGHTIALIVMNSKLREGLSKVFHCLRKQT
ncbi:taste receptor type 2 member 40-like [Candoia aspera]|uniref:taste receptor type 2 member 40-like n=1 Tax=Candoia aspera TaxID=51853 RepID=UPI002FD830F1